MTICRYCMAEVSEREIEAEDGCCPECGAVIAAGAGYLGQDDEFEDEFDDLEEDEFSDFDDENEDGFTWSRWDFPLLTTAESLKKIDQYLEQYLRFLSTGRHTKKNFNVRYEELKELGFRSLVNEYYKRRWNKNQRRES